MATTDADAEAELELAQAQAEADKAKKPARIPVPVPTAAQKGARGPDWEALGRGGAQGASVGFSDELSGVFKALQAKGLDVGEWMATTDLGKATALALMTAQGGRIPSRPEYESVVKRAADETRDELGLKGGLVENYRRGRDEERAANKEAEERSPLQYGGAELAGSLAVPMPPVSKAAKGASWLSRVPEYAVKAAPVGAAFGLGKSEADVTKGDVAGAVNDVEQGTKAAMLTGGLVGPTFEKAGQYLKQRALLQALRALNPSKRDVARLATSGNIENVPQDLLDSGLIKPFDTAEKIEGRVSTELEKRGEALGDVKAGIDAATQGQTVIADQIADRIERDVVQKYAQLASPEAQATAADAQARADLIRKMYGQKAIPLETAESAIKQAYADAAEKYANAEARGGVIAPGLDAAKGAYSAARAVNEDAAEAAARGLAPDLAGKFVPAKQAYGRMAAASQTLAPNAAPKALANRAYSPSDYGFGIATGQAYLPDGVDIESIVKKVLPGWLGAIVHKVIRERGNATAAVVYNALAPLADAAAPKAAKVAAVVALMRILRGAPDQPQTEQPEAP